MKYRKKPVVIEAMQVTGPADMEKLREFVGKVDIVIGWDHEADEAITEKVDGFRWLMLEDNERVAQVYNIKSLSWCGLKLGDYIAKREDEFYPVDAEVMASDFDPVDE